MSFSRVLLGVQHGTLKTKKLSAFKAGGLNLSIAAWCIAPSTAVFHLREL
jgi:hypothetical protein